MTHHDNYELWRSRVTDPELAAELKSIKDNENEIRERFYGELSFGTAGLRGIISAGSNRMNIYTVGRTTQGFADYLNIVYTADSALSVVIGYDSRIKSAEFAEYSARVFAANGIKTYLFDSLVPTPLVSYSVRHLGCKGGVMVTASHNPAQYNGYKAYGPDGSQLSVEDSEKVIESIDKVNIFDDVKAVSFEEGQKSGKIIMVGKELTQDYLDEVAKMSIHPGICKESGLRLVYTPLNGAGNKPVRATLARMGMTDVHVVASQEQPDGHFPTCPYPNPEFKEALAEGLKLCAKIGADLLIATDPDSDRMGIAVRNGDEYRLMTGNEVGCLMFDYVFSQRKAESTMPLHPVAARSIVSSIMADAIGQAYGVEVRQVLTGFKYVGELVTELAQEGRENDFLMAFEESYGYLIGSHVRDKDAVVASMLLCEMAAFYKKQGSSLISVMEALYQRFGHYQNKVLNYAFEGVEGMQQMKDLMQRLRQNPPSAFASRTVIEISDYAFSRETDLASGQTKIIPLPLSDVLSYQLADGSQVIIRPSGTEPKVKAYLTVKAASEAASRAASDDLEAAVNALIK